MFFLSPHFFISISQLKTKTTSDPLWGSWTFPIGLLWFSLNEAKHEGGRGWGRGLSTPPGPKQQWFTRLVKEFVQPSWPSWHSPLPCIISSVSASGHLTAPTEPPGSSVAKHQLPVASGFSDLICVTCAAAARVTWGPHPSVHTIHQKPPFPNHLKPVRRSAVGGECPKEAGGFFQRGALHFFRGT